MGRRVVVVVVFAFVYCCLCAGLAGPVGAKGGASPEDGRTAEDLHVEEVLLSGEVVENELLGEGITRPRRLVLDHEGERVRAIFKTIDRDEYEPSYTSRVEMHFTDKYVYEYAAYRLDRYLGLGIVPVTVLREVDGVEGSVQLWIEDAIKLEEAMERQLEPSRPEYFLDCMQLMHVLDALIYNIDRNPSNILVRPEKGEFFAIDHSRSFRDSKELPWYGRDWSREIPEHTVTRLRALNEDRVRELSAGRLTHLQVRALLERRDLLLEELP